MSNDSTTEVYTDELQLMKKVFQTGSDFKMGQWCPEFTEFSGGIEKLKSDHLDAISKLEQWYDEVEE